MSSKPAASAAGSTETVKVMVRVRPMNTKEKTKGCLSCVKVDSKDNQIAIVKPDEEANSKSFAFDAVYDADSLQQTVYDESAFPLVESVIEGYNGTIFAYGQTGCGKTHTMLGLPELPGIIPGCFKHIFGYIDGNTQVGTKFLVRCSYLEIYNEEIHDLLVDYGRGQPAKLELKEDPNKGVFVKDLNCLIVKSIPEIERAMNFGTSNRKVAETQMNATSSRSHSIFTIYIETGEQINGEQRIKAGKLNLVDLAGSERQSKTGATGATLKEGIKINLSLTALGNVISALVDGKSQHIPYRDSKLTRLLQDSLGGNTKTVMIAAVSPADYNYEETLSTLRYAARAKAIKNKPRVNEDPKDALLKEYEEEIRKLKEMLSRMADGKEVGNVASEIKQFKRQIDNEQHIMMDIEELRDGGSAKKGGKGKGSGGANEETVEDLIAKLEQKGKKVVLQDQSFVGELRTPKGDDHRRTSISPDQNLQDELKTKEQLLEAERQQKEHLASLISEMEKKLVTGGQSLEEREREQMQKQREMQLQLRMQKKKEKQLQEEKRKKEEEMLLVEKHYKNLQEEVDDMRNIIRKLREKYKASQIEIEDLQRENQFSKEDLLETIRELDKDLKFANNVMKIALSGAEMEKIRSKSHWDENRSEWRVPMFYLNPNKGEKEVQFPTINGQSRANHAKENRDIGFGEDDAGDTSSVGAKGDENNEDYAVGGGGANGLGKPPKSLANAKSNGSGIYSQNAKSSLVGVKSNLQSSLNSGTTTGVKTSQNFNQPSEIPDRRKKYLQSIEDTTNESTGEGEQQQRRQRANVHLQPLTQVGLNNQQFRNMSLPQKHPKELENELMNQHPLNFAPSPTKVAPSSKPKLDRIDHENFRINSQGMVPGASGSQSDNGAGKMQYANLPSPTAGKRNKQLEPLAAGAAGMARGL